MKRILIVTILALLAITSFAQTKKYYCEIKGVEKELSSGLKIVFDFGNSPVYSASGLRGKLAIVDENGVTISFNSMVDAGNYLSDKGWEFVQAYSSTYNESAIVHWIFVKEASSPEEAAKGILTKNDFSKAK